MASDQSNECHSQYQMQIRKDLHTQNKWNFYFFTSLVENSICKIAAEKEEVLVAKHLDIYKCMW